jgi:hypothetical protein
VMWRYDADTGFVMMKNASDRNKTFFIRRPNAGGGSNGDENGIIARLTMCNGGYPLF